ncbi:MAG: carbon monoxide dehydrogenase subunit G [Chloroflexi bacterium]|nr:carbon monoxide dehydrogenase subunit G [Chloroflexota bacterium]
MKVEGTFTIKAEQDRVWELLQDPDVLAACIPGCEKLEPTGEDTYAATLNVGVAGIKGRYQGTVSVADRDPPHGYRMIVEGKGGPGFVKGEGSFTLSEEKAGETIIHVAGDGQAGGTLARVGQRLMLQAARLLMKQFFTRLNKEATAR